MNVATPLTVKLLTQQNGWLHDDVIASYVQARASSRSIFLGGDACETHRFAVIVRRHSP